MKKSAPTLVFLLLLTVVFSLATLLQPRALGWTEGRDSGQMMQALLGEGRQVLANQMFVEADVYFHSGYYPSLFDQAYAPTNAQHMTHADAQPGHAPDLHEHESHEEEEHEKAMSFLHEPRDWIERFGRKFAVTEHTHLSKGKEREMLPWLRLSAGLDPHRIETYTVAAFWLRRDLNKPKEAEEFLREGLKANPSSYEILLELGGLYYENYHDVARARNLWAAALRKWMQRESKKADPDLSTLGQITVRLAHLEEEDGNYARAVELLEMTLVHKASPHPEVLRGKIESLRTKLAKPAPR